MQGNRISMLVYLIKIITYSIFVIVLSINPPRLTGADQAG